MLVFADAPYLMFNGSLLPNNSYVNLTELRRQAPEGVYCHTDLPTCCSRVQGPHRGDWYFPDGERLQFPLERGLVEQRRGQYVLLRDHPYKYFWQERYIEGIYQCVMDTTALHGDLGNESVYIGLYETGGT